MKRYENRVVKLFKTMNNIMHWWNEYQVRLDNLLLESYPFNISFDEVVSEYAEAFGNILVGSNAYDIKETDVSHVERMIFAELRDMCELIMDFYKHDKERFLNETPDCCDGELLDKVLCWHNVNVVKNKSTQQKLITIEKGFLDIKVGDVVVVYDDNTSHDYLEHVLKITSIEYEDEYITETNPMGMHCYGDDLEEEWGDDYLTHANEANFVRFKK